MNRLLAVLAVAVALTACTNPERSRTTLEAFGFKDIAVGGYAAFQCGDDYTYATKFEATNALGKRVAGVVCCGVVKGCSIKL